MGMQIVLLEIQTIFDRKRMEFSRGATGSAFKSMDTPTRNLNPLKGNINWIFDRVFPQKWHKLKLHQISQKIIKIWQNEPFSNIFWLRNCEKWVASDGKILNFWLILNSFLMKMPQKMGYFHLRQLILEFFESKFEILKKWTNFGRNWNF